LSQAAAYEKWKSLQSHWDDDDFLKSLTPLMRLRYRRLDEKVLGYFQEAFAGQVKPLLLDLGAGRGEFALFLKDAGKDRGWDYLGLEPSAEQLAQRDIPTLGLGFVRGLAERVPLTDMTVQGVLVKEALDHCFDPAAVFQEARRLLKPGGLLIVTITNDQSYFKKLLPWVNRALKARQTDHLFFFGPRELQKLAQEARFDRVEIETYNYLKLPRVLERLIGALGPRACGFLLAATDRLGRALLPGLGGGLILRASVK